MNTWDRSDLERFVDDDLPAETAERVRTDLLESGELRSRLSEVRHTDTLLSAALGAPIRRRVDGRRVGAMLAAGLAVAAGAWAWIEQPWQSGGLTHRDHEVIAHAPLLNEDKAGAGVDEPDAFRGLVLEIPVRGVVVQPRAEAVEPSAPAASGANDPIDRAVRDGRVLDAGVMIAGATEEQRSRSLQQLAAMVRSGAIADQVLDTLPPAQQVEACRAWASEPRLRPAVFARLKKLMGDDEVGAAAAGLAKSFERSSELRAWAASYLTPRPGQS